MNIVKGRVLRRVLNRITDLISGALTLDNYTIGLARDDDTLVARDDVGGFHYFMGSMAIESLIVDLQYAREPVTTYALLPAGDPDGAMRVVLSEDTLYIKSNGTWTKSELDATDFVQQAGVTGSALGEIVTSSGPVFTTPAFSVRLFDNANFLGKTKTFAIPSQSISIPDDGMRRYVCAKRVGDSTSLVLLTQAQLYSISMSDVVPLWQVARFGSEIHQIGYDNVGDGLASKQEFMALRTEPYRIALEGGLSVTLTNRSWTMTGADVFFGHEKISVLPFSTATDKVRDWYHVGGVWTEAVATGGFLFPNTQYDNGANLVDMGLNKWGCIFVYRSIGDDKECFIVRGTSEANTEATAKLIGLPPTPDITQWHGVLTGRIIYQQGATGGTFEAYSRSAFVPSTVINHNDTAHLNTGDYQHLTAVEKTDLTDSGDCAIHYHASDRNRANHTGTQLASTISDLASAVRDVVLTGLSTAISTTILATDTILAALGKLQGQLNARPVNHASNGTTYGIASSTLYGHTKCSTTLPLMDGVASPGTDGALFSSYDHRHPSDTSREYAWDTSTLTASTDFDSLKTPLRSNVSNASGANGFPSGIYGYGAFTVIPRTSLSGIIQLYVADKSATASDGGMAVRVWYSSVWSEWSIFRGKAFLDAQYLQLAGRTSQTVEGSVGIKESGDSQPQVNLAHNFYGTTAKPGLEFRIDGGALSGGLYNPASGFLKTADVMIANTFRYGNSTVEATSFTTMTAGVNIGLSPTEGSAYRYKATPTSTTTATTLTLVASNMAFGAVAFLTLRNDGNTTGALPMRLIFPSVDGNVISYTLNSRSQVDYMIIRSGSGFRVIGANYV